MKNETTLTVSAFAIVKLQNRVRKTLQSVEDIYGSKVKDEVELLKTALHCLEQTEIQLKNKGLWKINKI